MPSQEQTPTAEEDREMKLKAEKKKLVLFYFFYQITKVWISVSVVSEVDIFELCMAYTGPFVWFHYS